MSENLRVNIWRDKFTSDHLRAIFWENRESQDTVQYRKRSPTANDPETANDPQNGPQINDPRPQVIPKVDRKWSRENLRNGMDFMGLILKKNPFSLAF